jgi:hypothetical protein
VRIHGAPREREGESRRQAGKLLAVVAPTSEADGGEGEGQQLGRAGSGGIGLGRRQLVGSQHRLRAKGGEERERGKRILALYHVGNPNHKSGLGIILINQVMPCSVISNTYGLNGIGKN